MKRAKRVTALIAVLVLMVCALAGCGGYEGRWKAVSAEYQGVSVSPEAFGFDMTLELQSGGKAAASMQGESAEGSWTQTDSGIDLTFNGETHGLSMENNRLVLEYGGGKIYLEKK